MYKTVRHGENSLQYTILPQDDGIVNVKPRRLRKKGKTAAILTITVILICGIIATAILVPLLLTSDLVVLPAAFQKFSVSSLHRSHSGNHMVVVAKKPHGWINPHHSLNNIVHPTGLNKSYNHMNINKPKENSVTQVLNTTTTATTVGTTVATTLVPKTTTEKIVTVMSNEIDSNRADEKKLMMNEGALRMYDDKYTEVPVGKNYLEISTTTRSSKGNELLGDGVVRLVHTEVQTTTTPWYHQRWSFGDSVTHVRWSGSNVTENFLSITVGIVGIVLLCLVTIFVVWMRRRRNLRNSVVKNSSDAKADDKATLLKESAVGSEEE